MISSENVKNFRNRLLIPKAPESKKILFLETIPSPTIVIPFQLF